LPFLLLLLLLFVALFRAQAQEIAELRRALARVTKDRHLSGVDYQELLMKKDKQLSQVWAVEAAWSKE
jgi:hypothetical protein